MLIETNEKLVYKFSAIWLPVILKSHNNKIESENLQN